MKKKEPSELFDTYEHASPAVREALETQEQEDPAKGEEDWKERFKHLFIEGNVWQSADGSTVYSAVGNMENFIATEIERAKAGRDEEILMWARKTAQPKNSGYEDEQRRIFLDDLINFLDTPQEGDNK